MDIKHARIKNIIEKIIYYICLIVIYGLIGYCVFRARVGVQSPPINIIGIEAFERCLYSVWVSSYIIKGILICSLIYIPRLSRATY